MKNYIYLILGIAYFGTYYYLLKYLGIEISDNYTQYLSFINGIFGIFLSFSIIGFFQITIDKIIKKGFKKTKNNYDDLIGELLINFINISKYILAVYIGLKIAIIPESIEPAINNIFNVSFIITGLILITSLINTVFKNLGKSKKLSKLSKNIFPIVNKIVVVFIWIFGLITIIGNLGFDISALITGAGVGGLAIALAAQKSVANIFGAVSVMINQPFKIGDFVKINGHTGTVSEIGLTYLTLFDITGHEILLPNENIISSSIENLSIRGNRKSDFSIGLTYNTSTEGVRKAVNIIESILDKEVKKETITSFRVNFDSFGDFSLNINTTYFSLLTKDYTEFLKQRQSINLKIKEEFEKEKLEMAFPTQEVILKK